MTTAIFGWWGTKATLGRVGDYVLRFLGGWGTTAILGWVGDYGDLEEGIGLRRFWRRWGDHCDSKMLVGRRF